MVNRAKVQQIKEDLSKKKKVGEEFPVQQDKACWLDIPAPNETQLDVPSPTSPGTRKATSPSAASRENDMNRDVFSRLLNPNKFTGIHRRLADSCDEEKTLDKFSSRNSKKL